MKFPKKTSRYCYKCKKHTSHTLSIIKGKDRGPLKKGSISRAHKRGRGIGYGNLGKWGSKPAISKFKMTGAKTSKKTNLKFTCEVCKKSSLQRFGIRTKKVVFE